MSNSASPKRPNIVLVIADHVAFAGHYRASFDGAYAYHWPHLERIAKQGAWFDKAYAITPICTPSRASMLTGKRADKHGMRWNCEYPIADNRKEFREDEILFPQALAAVGYDAYYFGKWHCGSDKGPQDYGIKGWSLPEYGNVYRSNTYKNYLKSLGEEQPKCRIDHHLMRPQLDGTEVLMDPDEPWDYMDGAGVLLGNPEVQEQFFVTNLACEQLRHLADRPDANAPDKEPFLLVTSLWGPHHPYYPSELYADQINPDEIGPYPSFADDLTDKPLRYRVHRDLRCLHRASERWKDWSTWQTVLARCYAAGLQTDAAIGRIYECLQETGLAEETLFIVTADHGDGIASHGGGWDKYSTFTEEVGRVPLVMHWPGQIAAGTKVSDPVNLLDMTATMLSAGGVDLETLHPLSLDGEDLLPFIGGQARRDVMICDHFGHSGDVSYQKILYMDGWKYVSVWGDEDELYDLEADPYELTNRITDQTTFARQKAMRDVIIDHLESRRAERAAWHKPEFLERGVVFSSPEWPREETLHLFKLKTQQGYET
ncbi:MAG: sulfatase-like hydrolase/transferase [Cohaesibacter sp.]|nr:sulfatase-like hydrolase/transferase [Cohaesibacter sp.]